ncbi:MAG: Asp-tRNA(Asn)/Glu-tRNA(Gln) amidotransferase GatCAB subunit B, partial [Gemmatimonadaceae bacterium]|nr:Asp-tRNA(Asn)/Glu-tRNA(Gln) amidotransferase GatCAB subunit B [Gemmatimonadaceae bacterium]
FPEPDLPPLVLTGEWITSRRNALPELPAPRRMRLQGAYGLTPYDAGVLSASRAVADYFEAVTRLHGDGKAAANWIMGEVMAYLNDAGLHIDAFRVTPAALAQLLDLVQRGTVSHSAAKKIFAVMITSDDPPLAIAERSGLTQVSDDAALIAWVDAVWREHPDETARLAAGEKKLLGVLVGLVMKQSKGRADPRKVNQLLNAKLPQ